MEARIVLTNGVYILTPLRTLRTFVKARVRTRWGASGGWKEFIQKGSGRHCAYERTTYLISETRLIWKY